MELSSFTAVRQAECGFEALAEPMEFVEIRDALEDFLICVLHERRPARLSCAFPQDGVGRAGGDEVLQLFVEGEQFEDADASDVSCVPAERASARSGLLGGEFFYAESQCGLLEGFGVLWEDVGVGNGAMGTELPEESLRDDAPQGAGDKIAFDTHVDKAVEGPDGIVGMES